MSLWNEVVVTLGDFLQMLSHGWSKGVFIQGEIRKDELYEELFQGYGI